MSERFDWEVSQSVIDSISEWFAIWCRLLAVKQGCFWEHDRTQKCVNIETIAMTRSTVPFAGPFTYLYHSLNL